MAHRWGPGLLLLFALTGCSGKDPEDDGGCAPDDQDGVVGGKYTFEVTVDDMGFMPAILKVQNTSAVTIELTNMGTSAHGFGVGCIPTPNDVGCAPKSCFPDEATIDPLDPDGTTRLKFTVPLVEGIYPIESTASDDVAKAQFVVQ